MANQRQDILFPVGRMVAGSCYKPRDKDAEGKPLVVKNGPDAGKPRVDFFIAVAIPKTPGHTHWSQTPWGQTILAAGAAAFPQQYQSPKFAWKIEDGDSQVPNTRGRKPCDNEGWPGHWVVKLSGGYAPKVCTADGSQPILEEDAVKAGYYVQVFGNVSGNGSVQQPGVYLNHSAVALAGYGPEIRQGLDTTSVGFGGALPPGASATPIGAMVPPAAVAPAVGAPALQMPGIVPPAAAVTPPPLLVQPNPGILAFPGASGAAAGGAPAPLLAPPPLPPVPVVQAAVAAPQLTPQGVAAGGSYERFISGGWTDAQMRAAGYLV